MDIGLEIISGMIMTALFCNFKAFLLSYESKKNPNNLNQEEMLKLYALLNETLNNCKIWITLSFTGLMVYIFVMVTIRV